MDARSSRNDAYRDALGYTRAEACCLVAVVSAWLSGRGAVTAVEVNELVEREDPSGITAAGHYLPRLAPRGLVISKAPSRKGPRPYLPTPEAVRLVIGWTGRTTRKAA
jgi:hypothetical protein